jgi:hypothetical protein
LPSAPRRHRGIACDAPVLDEEAGLAALVEFNQRMLWLPTKILGIAKQARK